MKPPNALTIQEAVTLLRAIEDAVKQAQADSPDAVALWWAGRSAWKVLNLSVDVRTGEASLTDCKGNSVLATDILEWMYTEAPNHPTKPEGLPE